MTLKDQGLFWAGAFALFLGTVWLFSDILLPFVLGIAIAYLLNPPVIALGKMKISRLWATIIMLAIFMIVTLVLLMLIIPPLYRESTQLADALPNYMNKLWDMLEPHIKALQSYVGPDDLNGKLRNAVENNIGNALQVSISLLGGLINGGQAVISFITVCVFTPFVAFFMMVEWNSITKWVDNLLPRHSYDTIKDLLSQINTKLSGFVRGQLLVALVLGIVYAVALTLAGLDFGFLIGLGAGVLSIIPLVGSTTGLLVSVLVAWFQSGEWTFVALIASIFLIGQFVEGNILTPKLLGGSVGLHPLWILFALMAGGAMFGIVGMLLAVPVASVIGVLGGFAIKQYKASPYYTDKKAASNAGASAAKPSQKSVKKSKAVKTNAKPAAKTAAKAAVKNKKVTK